MVLHIKGGGFISQHYNTSTTSSSTPLLSPSLSLSLSLSLPIVSTGESGDLLRGFKGIHKLPPRSLGKKANLGAFLRGGGNIHKVGANFGKKARTWNCRGSISVVTMTGGTSKSKDEGVSSSLVTWKGSVSVQRSSFLVFNNFVADVSDRVSDLFGSRVNLWLVSVDPEDPTSGTGEGKRSSPAYLENWPTGPARFLADKETQYLIHFKVEKDFGIPGAILVENNHPYEFLLKDIKLELQNGSQTITFTCNSWVYKPTIAGDRRIFFSNKNYLPSQTPQGLKELRKQELKNLRGDGTGERKTADRIYDYEVYNDLGNPDKAIEHARTTLGGNPEFPYPRRCRTGRPATKTDPNAETPLNIFSSLYVPRDEAFDLVKGNDFLGSGIKAFVHAILPLIKQFLRSNFNYKSFDDVDSLYSSSALRDLRKKAEAKKQQLSQREIEELERFRGLTDPKGGESKLLKFPVPEIIQVTTTAWRDDREFARQVLVGVNPMVITRLDVFPPTSELDPKIYGSTTSCITKEDVEKNMDGVSVEEALEKKLLYIVDYHDVLLPYVERINKEKGKSYASRTIFFLKSDGTLKPVAIELSLPQSSDGQVAASRRVFTPPTTSTSDPSWELAKVHMIVNDSGYHELVSHWLRTHASIEPIIIATRRQLSAMHPIYSLLLPHFKNNMRINATARNNLINSFSGSLIDGGIIEYSFTPVKYSMELSSKVYKSNWRLDQESLPADLIKRGVAEEDPSAKHGLKLLIPDYPYAVDGLDIWDSINNWAHDYVRIFYPQDSDVADDEELQAWWAEVRYKGHADKALEEWWPSLTTCRELGDMAATIMWLASAHHAAVNFGQFGYGGYPPSRPSMSRLFVPEKGTPEYEKLVKDPDTYFFKTISSGPQSLIVIATLEILSNHAPNEEYIGDATPAINDTANQAVQAALDKFKSRLRDAERAIQSRNDDQSLLNREGISGIDYAIMFPTAGLTKEKKPKSGLTGRGIPNSVSI